MPLKGNTVSLRLNKISLRTKLLQRMLGGMLAGFFSLSGLTAFAGDDLPAVQYNVKDQQHQMSASVMEIGSEEDRQTFELGFQAEVNAARANHHSVKVSVFYEDVETGAAQHASDHTPSAEVFAHEVANQVDAAEVSGETLKAVKLPALSASEARYVRRANTTAYLVRVGGISAIETIHLCLVKGAPFALNGGLGAALMISGAMLFKTFYTERIGNLINYLKFKKYSDKLGNMHELKSMVEKIETYT